MGERRQRYTVGAQVSMYKLALHAVNVRELLWQRTRLVKWFVYVAPPRRIGVMMLSGARWVVASPGAPRWA